MVDTRLDSYLAAYTKFNDWLIQRRYQKLANYFVGDSCLEMGSAEGAGTKYLVDNFNQVTAVDGSKDAIEFIQKEYPTVTAVHSYFEDMDFGGQKFDTIVLAHILEHVDGPVTVLKQAKKFLADGGVMIIDVPNGNSLHRQVGVELGLLEENTQLNDADLSIGHQRVYVPETFKMDVIKSGLKVKQFGGMFIKVISNSQTEKVFDESQLEALFDVGENNPEIAAEIFIIATNR